MFRTRSDFKDFWSDIRVKKKVVLWCDGLKCDKKRKSTRSENSEPPAKKKKASHEDREDKEERVLNTIDELQEKHGSAYTPMQLRIWGEMIVGKSHASFTVCPKTSMFVRAGSSVPAKKKSDSSQMTDAVTQAAVAISSALSPHSDLPTCTSSGTGTSPAKLIEARSKCYKQLHDLNNLKTIGVLSICEYDDEKEIVMAMLKKLK